MTGFLRTLQRCAPLIFQSVCLTLPLLAAALPVSAQSDPGTEPDLALDRKASSPYAQRLKLGTGVDLVLSNFGFAFGGFVEYAVLPTRSVFFAGHFSGLRDASEQTFTNVFGQQFIPNKYSRIFAIPVVIGVRQRLFPEVLSDNFRFHLHTGIGLARTFVYPYFQDSNANFIWDPPSNDFPLGETIYDPLQGWDQGSWKTGLAGKIGLSVDFGEDFETFTSIYFGADLYYYRSGIQVLEPYRLIQVDGAQALVPSASPLKMFVSPVIRFSFGRNWKMN